MLVPLLLLSLAQARTATPEIKAWEGLKYGMFIHYGMSTFDQSEINDGKSAPSVYNPTSLDVRQWIHVAKQAGMKYAVLTAKHTAGFCLWPSGDYDVSESPVKTDVVGAFMAACKAEGLKAGIYYCIMDGHREGGVEWSAPVSASYFALIEKHLTQLHTRYPGIFEQWLDIPAKLSVSQQRELYELVHRLNPHCLVLMNVSNWKSPGTTMPAGAWPTDLAVGERNPPPAMHNSLMTVEGQGYYVPLEICDTLEENWFWVRGDSPRPLRRLAGIWSSTVGRGANLLLDVPPDTTGRIPESSVQRLLELRKWIEHPTAFPVSLTLRCAAGASNMYQNDSKWSASNAVDGKDDTRWACDDSVHSAWLEVDLSNPKTFGETYIAEAYPNRVQSFELQRLVNGQWDTFYKGKSIGADFHAKFKPVTAQHVRLNILDSTVGPTIWEFQLFESAPRGNSSRSISTPKGSQTVAPGRSGDPGFEAFFDRTLKGCRNLEHNLQTSGTPPG